MGGGELSCNSSISLAYKSTALQGNFLQLEISTPG